MQDKSIDSAIRVTEALRMFRPHGVAGIGKIRVGRDHDGGYVMADRFDGIIAAYSLGINDDVSWDLALAERGIPIYQYDHTIDGLPVTHQLFNWRKKGVSGHTGKSDSMDQLANLLLENGHSAERNLILKCDIECSEWPMIEYSDEKLFGQFRQIVMEIHSLDLLSNSEDGDKMLGSLRKLFRHHHLIHLHANNTAPWAIVGGIPLPHVLEITLLRKDEGEFNQSDEMFPGPLDMPCDPAFADYHLGNFIYD